MHPGLGLDLRQDHVAVQEVGEGRDLGLLTDIRSLQTKGTSTE